MLNFFIKVVYIKKNTLFWSFFRTPRTPCGKFPCMPYVVGKLAISRVYK